MEKLITLSIEEFLEEMGQDFTQENMVYNIFQHFKHMNFPCDYDEGPWIAGGCLEALAKNKSLKNRDIDVWTSVETWVLLNNWFKGDVHRSKRSETIRYELDGNFFNLQRIKTHLMTKPSDKDKLIYEKTPLIHNIWHLLGNFDFSICQVATDLENIYTTQTSLNDLKENRITIMNTMNSNALMERYIKYLFRGYEPRENNLEKIENLARFFDTEKLMTGDFSS